VRKLAGRLRGEDADIIGLPVRGVNTSLDPKAAAGQIALRADLHRDRVRVGTVAE